MYLLRNLILSYNDDHKKVKEWQFLTQKFKKHLIDNQINKSTIVGVFLCFKEYLLKLFFAFLICLHIFVCGFLFLN